jgi:small subunit ribosomal protein S15e
MKLLPCRQRRRLTRGLKRRHVSLLKKLRSAKKAASALEKPATIKTHLRDMIIMPEMVGSVIGIYNGKQFNQVRLSYFGRAMLVCVAGGN